MDIFFVPEKCTSRGKITLKKKLSTKIDLIFISVFIYLFFFFFSREFPYFSYPNLVLSDLIIYSFLFLSIFFNYLSFDHFTFSFSWIIQYNQREIILKKSRKSYFPEKKRNFPPWFIFMRTKYMYISCRKIYRKLNIKNCFFFLLLMTTRVISVVIRLLD